MTSRGADVIEGKKKQNKKKYNKKERKNRKQKSQITFFLF